MHIQIREKMKIYADITKHKPRIVKTLNKYGFSPEHNYYNYLYTQNAAKKCMFFEFGQRKGILAFFNKENNTWRIINGLLAPQEERLGIFMHFLDYAKEQKSGKVFVEAAESLKSEIFNKLKDSYNLNVNYILHWPVYNLANLDERLSGKKWKKLRNIKNRFYKSFRVEIQNPKKINKEILKKVLFQWARKRYPRDRANHNYYANIIDNSFKGFDVLRAISLNGEVCAFSGGWQVPNSATFYCGVGIFNYLHRDLGDFANLDDLLHLKKMGYKHIDMGGSEKSLLHFKKKFGPAKIYKTYAFSVSPKK